jgi:hypothetical protein
MTNSFIIFLIRDRAAFVRSSPPPEFAGAAERSLESVVRAGLPLEGHEIRKIIQFRISFEHLVSFPMPL